MADNDSKKTSPPTPTGGPPAAPAHEDSPLESLGKAISAPVLGAAEDEEPGPDGAPPVKPGG